MVNRALNQEGYAIMGRPAFYRPAVSGTVELTRTSLCILPDLCKHAKNKNAFRTRSLDGAKNAPPTGCTGVLLVGRFKNNTTKSCVLH